jgi:GxxExxY protein
MNADDCRPGELPDAGLELRLKEAATTQHILGAFYEVYNELGSGFLESVYREALAIALGDRGLRYERQTRITVVFRGVVIGAFRADFVVGSKVLVELKATRALDDAHVAQTLNYLRATNLEVALLLNFGPKPSFKRLFFDNVRKSLRRS